METEERSFSRGEVVWAKLTGYPWWPAAVRPGLIQIAEVDIDPQDPSVSTCLIKFFGEDSQYICVLQLLAACCLSRRSQNTRSAALSSRGRPAPAKSFGSP